MAAASVLEENESHEKTINSGGKNCLDLFSDRICIRVELSSLLRMEKANVSTAAETIVLSSDLPFSP